MEYLFIIILLLFFFTKANGDVNSASSLNKLTMIVAGINTQAAIASSQNGMSPNVKLSSP